MKVIAFIVLFGLLATLASSVPAWGGSYGYKIAAPHYSVSHYGYAPAYGYYGYPGYGGYGWGGHGGYGGYGKGGWW
ncbi:shematrin-like protein 1 [Oppia nitens]|uniref:shematrin-like protein 1 n=1 Tax=Oppia nitens TaxID=1686743 RepID=UPI0023D9B5F7|nr:shematrin-like protein 1 [Oppia nitens]